MAVDSAQSASATMIERVEFGAVPFEPTTGCPLIGLVLWRKKAGCTGKGFTKQAHGQFSKNIAETTRVRAMVNAANGLDFRTH